MKEANNVAVLGWWIFFFVENRSNLFEGKCIVLYFPSNTHPFMNIIRSNSPLNPAVFSRSLYVDLFRDSIILLDISETEIEKAYQKLCQTDSPRISRFDLNICLRFDPDNEIKLPNIMPTTSGTIEMRLFAIRLFTDICYNFRGIHIFTRIQSHHRGYFLYCSQTSQLQITIISCCWYH